MCRVGRRDGHMSGRKPPMNVNYPFCLCDCSVQEVCSAKGTRAVAQQGIQEFNGNVNAMQCYNTVDGF